MHSNFLVLLLAGCTAVPTATSTAVHPPAVIEVGAPPTVHPRFAVVPTELGDPGISQRLVYRTRVIRWGNLWLKPDGDPVRMRPATEVTEELVLPVIDAMPRRIRVVIEDDGARYAAWIARESTATVPIVAIQLADRDGRAFAGSGVFLDPGATITLGEHADHRREVTVRDDVIRARGFVPVSALGEVWRMADAPRADGPKKLLDAEMPIRARPDASADTIAVAGTAIDAVELAPEMYSGWTAIEIARPFVRIRGYVPAGSLHASDGFGTIGHGSGHGFGISDTDRATLVVGTCLFDTAGGEVIGVNLIEKERYAYAPNRDPGWWTIYVDSPWQSVAMYAHELGGDPKHPKWETCGTYAK